jgi:hypothetical protein
VLDEFGSIKLRGGVMVRITLDILDLANLGETVPPRDPDDDDEAEDEEDGERDDDLDPAVIREPDEWTFSNSPQSGQTKHVPNHFSLAKGPGARFLNGVRRRYAGDASGFPFSTT